MSGVIVQEVFTAATICYVLFSYNDLILLFRALGAEIIVSVLYLCLQLILLPCVLAADHHSESPPWILSAFIPELPHGKPRQRSVKCTLCDSFTLQFSC